MGKKHLYDRAVRYFCLSLSWTVNIMFAQFNIVQL